MGTVTLPRDFDYKEALGRALANKYNPRHKRL